jgi:PAS domain S-box-containing protein
MEQPPIRILLVEKEEADAEAVRRSLEPRGDAFQIKVVSTLREASETLREYTPDLVISNWILSDGKAQDLLPVNRDDLQFPMVVLTSRGNEQLAVEAMKAGALDYVVKSPETLAEIPHIVDRTLREWHHIAEHKRADQKLLERTRELGERVKELNCLLEISEIVEDQGPSLGRIIQGIVDLLPTAWKYPEITCARATVQGYEFVTDGFAESPWFQKAIIKVRGKRAGSLEINYGKEQPEEDEGPFLKEERRLLDAVAERLGRIVERIGAERTERESQERLRAIFEAAKEAVFLKDRDLNYTHVNPAFCNLLGVNASELLGKRATDFYGEEVGNHIQERDARALAGERIEMEQTRPVQGTLITFHDTIVPLRDSKNEIVGICGISRDITTRTKLLTGHQISSDCSLSPVMQATFETARIAANTDSIVLLQGESGSGKDHLARWIHEQSRRASGPFFAVNCAAIAKELAESELFGHERGAFTGAMGRKKGNVRAGRRGHNSSQRDRGARTIFAVKAACIPGYSFVPSGGRREARSDRREAHCSDASQSGD